MDEDEGLGTPESISTVQYCTLFTVHTWYVGGHANLDGVLVHPLRLILMADDGTMVANYFPSRPGQLVVKRASVNITTCCRIFPESEKRD